jgi:4-hydroxy-3-polyprenylbenzoate decarboxylase
MKKKTIPEDDRTGLSRRDLIQSGIGLAALGSVSTGAAATSSDNSDSKNTSSTQAPFDSMRDFIAALDEHGLVVRIPRIDQDAYQVAAMMYRMRDVHGMRGAPAMIFDQVRIDGKWIDGPLVVNESGHLDGECLAFGLEPADPDEVFRDPYNSYRKARDHMEQRVAKNDGEYPTIDPVEVSAADAVCKEITLTGDDIDLTAFPFIQCNPGDAGRYINTGVVYTSHPKYGINFGTYRCHLRGPREIALNTEPGQTGYRHLMAARQRGEKTAPVSIALTTDPYIWMVSGSKMALSKGGRIDETAIAGGLAGRPTAVVRSETNDFMVPAFAEMIIEGEVPLDDLRPEGPYGEMVGYQGRQKQEVFWVRVTAVTHRRKPWIMNNFTGLQAGSLMAASHARSLYRLKQAEPSVTDFFSDTRAVGVTFVSINKTHAGQGQEIAEKIARENFFAKIVIVVDDDLDVTNHEQMLAALGARWQPYGNTQIFESLPALPLDPSTSKKGRGSKISIDATRQWPEEGGPENPPEMNRTLLEEGAPDAFVTLDHEWGELIRDWRSS